MYAYISVFYFRREKFIELWGALKVLDFQKRGVWGSETYAEHFCGLGIGVAEGPSFTKGTVILLEDVDGMYSIMIPHYNLVHTSFWFYFYSFIHNDIFLALSHIFISLFFPFLPFFFPSSFLSFILSVFLSVFLPFFLFFLCFVCLLLFFFLPLSHFLSLAFI